MTPEGYVKNEVKKILRSLGIRPFPDYGPNGAYFMPVQSRFATKGVSDFVLNVCGLFTFIETKANGDEPTDLQGLTLTANTLAKGLSLVIDERNLAHLRDVLTNVIGNKRDAALQLSWRRQSLPTSKDHHKKSRAKSKAPDMERNRDWKDLLCGMGD